MLPHFLEKERFQHWETGAERERIDRIRPKISRREHQYFAARQIIQQRDT
jgi:hypothetical protein